MVIRGSKLDSSADPIMAGYCALAAAVVEQAIRDYRAIWYQYKMHPDIRAYKARVDEMERFFRSDYFSLLSDLDPDRLISDIKEYVDEGQIIRRPKPRKRREYRSDHSARRTVGKRGRKLRRGYARQSPGVPVLPGEGT